MDNDDNSRCSSSSVSMTTDVFYVPELSFQKAFHEGDVPSTTGHTRLQQSVLNAAHAAYREKDAATHLRLLLEEVKAKRCVPLVDLASVTRQVEALLELAGGDEGGASLYYPAKTNYDMGILRTLALDPRVKFDCSGVKEMSRCLEAGASPYRVAYFNPHKCPADVVWSLRKGVRLFDLDSVAEVTSMENAVRAAGVDKVRVLVRTTQLRGGRPDFKFGVDEAVVNNLIDAIAETNCLDLVGFHFHIGTHEKEVGRFAENIQSCDRAAAYAVSKGYEMKMLDVGGGFPNGATKDNMDIVREYVREIKKAKRKSQHFKKAEVLYEGGTYTVGACMAIAVRVIAVKPSVPADDEGTRHQIVVIQNGDAGLFNLYSKEYLPFTMYPPLHIRDNPDAVPEPLENVPEYKADDLKISEEPLYGSLVFGPTCDESDLITVGPTDRPQNVEPLPAMSRGDWLVYPIMGAYAQNYVTTFCGFVHEPTAYYWSALKEDDVYGVSSEVRSMATMMNGERKPVHPAEIDTFRTETLFSRTLECTQLTTSAMRTCLSKMNRTKGLTVFTCGAGESMMSAASTPGVDRVINVDINETTAAIALLKWHAVRVLELDECFKLLTAPTGESFVRASERRPLLEKVLVTMPAGPASLLSVPSVHRDICSRGVDQCGVMGKCYAHGGQCLSIAGLHPILNTNVDWEKEETWEAAYEIVGGSLTTCPVSPDVVAFRGDSFVVDMMPRLRKLRAADPEAFRVNTYARYFLGLGALVEHDSRRPLWKELHEGLPIRGEIEVTSEAGDLLEALAKLDTGRVDFVDLSNIPEFLPLPVMKTLADMLADKVAPGGGVLYRNHSAVSIRDTFDEFLFETGAFRESDRKDVNAEETSQIYLETVTHVRT